MITCVTWIPSGVCKEWPDKVHEIPIKNLPVKIDNFMPVEPDVMQQFLEEEEDSNEPSNDNENVNNETECVNPRKRKLSELESSGTDKQIVKKAKTMNDELDGNDADNESDSEDDRFADIEDPEDFANAVLEGYDDEPLDFLSRIAGLHSGIGVGPTHYTYDESKKTNKAREKRHRIITTENIYDTKNDSEIEDIHIKKSDEIFICLGCDEDRESSNMQFYIFDTEKRVFYEHHDITLPAFPLCCKWLTAPNIGSNLLAIGSIEETIEIFNLDVMDALEPIRSFGGRIQTEEGAKLLKKWNEDIDFNYSEMNQTQKLVTLGELKKGSHSDSVLSLDWNALNGSFLFSGSADKSIKIWDLNRGKCVNTFDYHSDKVQNVALKLNDPNLLLSGGFDKNIFLLDVKSKKQVNHWKVLADLECLQWHPHNENLFMCTLDNGQIQCFDLRKMEKPIWRIKGHKKAVTAFAFSKDEKRKGLFATGSMDKKVKLWHQKSAQSKPMLVCEQSNTSLGGSVFSMDFAPKRLIASTLIVGGNENFAVWDVESDLNVRRFFDMDNEKTNANEQGTKDDASEKEVGARHQHFIMEQTFNYKEDEKIVIDNDEDMSAFLDE